MCRRGEGWVRDRSDESPQSSFKQVCKKHGITVKQYDEMYERQKGCCAICGVFKFNRGKHRLVIDHCHNTGVVRGLLCNHCNVGLGFFRDRVDTLAAAIQYLR